MTPELAEAVGVIRTARARALHPSSPAPAVPPAVERTGPRPAADDAHRGRAGDHQPDEQKRPPRGNGTGAHHTQLTIGA